MADQILRIKDSIGNVHDLAYQDSDGTWALVVTDQDGYAKAEQIRALLAGTLAVSAASLPLPTGAATEATLDLIRGYVNDVETQLTSLLASSNTLGTEATLLKVLRGLSDYRTQLDYDGRTDGNPVYVGFNTQIAANGVATWLVLRLTYDSDDRMIDKQVLTGSWTGRAGLSWT